MSVRASVNESMFMTEDVRVCVRVRVCVCEGMKMNDVKCERMESIKSDRYNITK